MTKRDDQANVEWSDTPEHLEERYGRRRRHEGRADASKSSVEWSSTPEHEPDQVHVKSQWRGPDLDSESGPSPRNYLAAAAIVILGPVTLVALVALVSTLAGGGESPPRTTTIPRSTTTGIPLPAPDPDVVATATTITFGPDTDEPADSDVTALLIAAWASILDEHRRGNPAGWSADWCPLSNLSDADLAGASEAQDLRRAVDAAELDPESERLAFAALLVVTRDRLDRYC